ncbi:MAG: capsular polysaccharide biosynthesis protein [Firmicutes bacterium]|nr:capsular polysaccharide biosynthesis protein [Bacillota bacterium]
MIDFHSHFLPKIDDGSSSREESLEMLTLSRSYGIDTIVATQHFYIKRNGIDKFIEKRSASYDALKEKLPDDDSVPDIILGAEVYYFNGISGAESLEKLCIGDTSYMLLEMPFEQWSEKVLRDVTNIISTRNITPILAHIERFIPYQNDMGVMNEMLTLDLFVQMNAEYVNDFFTRKKAINMIRDNTVQLLGSDCHNMKKRKPNLDKAFSIIEKKLGKDFLERIDSLGRKILGIK